MIIESIGTSQSLWVDFGLRELKRLNILIDDGFVNVIIAKLIQTLDVNGLGIFS